MFRGVGSAPLGRETVGRAMTRAQVRVARLAIENLRGVERLELEFLDAFDRPLPVIVLVGPNGSGKTTVIEAIVLALGQRELLPEDSARLDDQVRFGASDFHVSADLAAPEIVRSMQGYERFVLGDPQRFDPSISDAAE